MIVTRPPKDGCGYIYILSNPSMPNIFKVGLTTNSVLQRIRELNGTGIPKPFKAENLFEVDISKLRNIEQLAHKKLAAKDMHHGKEFFEGSLKDCVSSVEDAIYELTESTSTELVGEAKLRLAAENANNIEKARREAIALEVEKLRQYVVDKEKQDSLKQLEAQNQHIDRLREEYIANYNQKKETSTWDKFLTSLGFIFISIPVIAFAVQQG